MSWSCWCQKASLGPKPVSLIPYSFWFLVLLSCAPRTAMVSCLPGGWACCPSGGLIVCCILSQAVRTAGSALNSMDKMILVNLELLLPCLVITLQGVSCKRWLPLMRCASPHGRSVQIWLIACELWELGWICARF